MIILVSAFELRGEVEIKWPTFNGDIFKCIFLNEIIDFEEKFKKFFFF